MPRKRRNKPLFRAKGSEKGRRVRRPFLLSRVRAAVCLGLGLGLGALVLPSAARAASRGYIVTEFDSIRVEAPVRVVLTAGAGVTARGEGERAALDRVDLAVSGGVLTVRLNEDRDMGFASSSAAEAPLLTLSTGQLRRASLMGGGVLTIHALSGQEAVLAMNGNGEISADGIDVERLSLFVGGGGRLTARGRAGTVRVTVNGPGALDAEGLDAHGATVSNDGPGTVRLGVHGPVSVVSTGSGDTLLSGKPICTVTQRGVGRVICLK